jgi:class 3 adenylate cyclase
VTIEPPTTRYAKTADGVHIAYQVVGDSGRDFVFVWGTYSNVEIVWEDPAAAHLLERVASFSRLIHFDKRGTGLSDRSCALPTYEEQIDDVLAVLDAVGSQRAALLGGGDGGMLAALFAASHPERISALILTDSSARRTRADDYPYGPTVEEMLAWIEAGDSEWGTGVSQMIAAPSQAGDDDARRWWAKMERHSLSVGSRLAVWDILARTDIRPILPTIHVPTLVLHRVGDTYVELAMGRYLAEHIPGARFVELAGIDHAGWAGDADALIDEIEEFVTGERPDRVPDRVLATVLFTDIVGSTAKAAAVGDAEWRRVLDRHHQLVRRQLQHLRGREIKTTGDGFLATFDGPARAIRCAAAVRDEVRSLGLEVRAGVHTGEVELVGDDVAGMAVHIGARVAAEAAAGEVLVSSTVKDLVVGADFRFEDRGLHTLKGVPGQWLLYAVA